ncbi:polysaccharide deacetylase family protein [Patiriisocius marinus]|uniref:polysaccharide deacetylase family protein n=1 Tax=Patiriisocius marinus TaxID=1397112 RepID=UPI002330FDFA|nr:polysaccharide deacetylase family protein [Patiriisocius marinus]
MLNFKTVNVFFTLLVAILIVASFFVDLSYVVFITIGSIWLLVTMCGSGFIRWNYFFKSLYSNPNTQEPIISITFDDGPHPEFTPRVLDLLKQHNAKATFFCIGNNIKANPKLLNQIINEGHTVGNHTYHHANNFGFLATNKVVGELNKTTTLIKEVSGKTVKMYRPAFGVTNPRIKRAIATTKLVSIGWNKRSLDTLPFSKEYTLKRITRNLKPGDVILLHDTSEKSIAVLEHLLLFLQKHKLKSVTVDQLLNIQPYE